MIQGTPSFDGIAVAKIEVDFLQNPTHIDVQAAFINVRSGDTHGWTRGSPGWSDQTRELIVKLRESMEQDLANRHFSGGGVSPTAATQQRTAASGGIGEHLGGEHGDSEGAPSV